MSDADDIPLRGGTQDIFFKRGSKIPLPLIDRAKGIYMWDEFGNKYIDASSGPVISNIGHGNENVANAMAKQAMTVDFAYSRVAKHRPNMELSRRLSELAGPGYERVNFVSGGSEAVEIAIKLVRQYVVATGQSSRTKIISCMPSYHGGTISLLGITGDESFAPFLENFGIKSEKISPPFSYRLPDGHTVDSYSAWCADALEEKIVQLGPKNVLAFIIEPVGGLSTGCLVPPASYFQKIREICDRHGVFLIFDEVLCGSGRTGKFLAAHHWPDALPDIVVVAKGLASGYTPLGAVLASSRLVDELARLTGFNFSHTYSANPISSATALAVLDEYDRLNLVQCAEVRGKTLKKGLQEMQKRIPIIGDVRGLGLLLAVELVLNQNEKKAFPKSIVASDRIRIHGLSNGLILYTRRVSEGKYGDWFMVSPPLTITEDECEDLLQRLEKTLNDFITEIREAGVFELN